MAGARRRWGAGQLLASAVFLLATSPAVAQTTPPVTTLPPTREEVTRPLAPPVTRVAPTLEVEGGIERSPCALDGPEYRSIHFVLRGVEFDGLQGLTSEEIAAAYAPYVGRDVPISVICEIRDRAATMLRNAGYVAAVQVPEQEIGAGTVRFRVLMARLTQVRVRGDASGAERIIAGYLNRLVGQPAFNRLEAERYLLLASDLPGYNVRLTLRPAGTTPGDVLGDVTVQRTRGYADFNIQNGGSDALGPWGGLVRGQLFGLTGLADRTSLSLFTTADFHEQQTYQLGHDFRVGSSGLSLSNVLTYAVARPSIPDASVLAHTLLNTFEVGYPLVRSEAYSIRTALGLDIVNQNVRFNTIELSRDRLRVAFLRIGGDAAATEYRDLRYSRAEPPWRVAGLVELRKGLHMFGATDCGPASLECIARGETPPGELEGRSDATVLRYNAYGEFRPIPKLAFALGARGQYSSRPLLSFESFSAGNYTAGRGYDPGTLLGDTGFGTQAEIRFGSAIPSSARKPAIVGYGFWDHAWVSNRDKLTVVAQSDHLNSVGAGARVNFDRFALDAAVAVPLTRVGIANRRPDARFLLSLTTRLFPWSYR